MWFDDLKYCHYNNEEQTASLDDINDGPVYERGDVNADGQIDVADINILIALLANIIIDYVVLRYIDRLEKILGGTLISILRKFFGVILLAIGVKLITTNLGSIIQSLNP